MMKTKREVLNYIAETGTCPDFFDCDDCPYLRRCRKLTVLIRKIGARELLKMFPQKREFDKSKILTSVTADQAKVGMRGYFADTYAKLKCRFKNNEVYELLKIYSEDEVYRFKNELNDYALFYPIDEEGEE